MKSAKRISNYFVYLFCALVPCLVIAQNSTPSLSGQNLQTGTSVRTISEFTGPVFKMFVSADERKIATISDDKKIYLWNSSDGSPLCLLSGHKDEVCYVDFSPNGRYLASGSKDETIKIWDLQNNGSLIKTITSDACVDAVRFTYDGTGLIFGNKEGDLMITDWDGNLKKKFFLPDILVRISAIIRSSDGKNIIVKKRNEYIFMIKTDSSKIITFRPGTDQSSSTMKFSSDEKEIIVLKNNGPYQNFYYYNSDNFQGVYHNLVLLGDDIKDFSYSINMDLVYCAYPSKILAVLLEKQPSKTIRNIEMISFYPTALYLTRDNTKLFAAGWGSDNIRIYSNLNQYNLPSELTLNKTNIGFKIKKNGNLSKEENVSVGNLGYQKLSWYITGVPDWLEVEPKTGEENTVVKFKVKKTNLNTGYYSTNVTFTNRDNLYNSKNVNILLLVVPPFSLSQNYPNPFSGSTHFDFSLPETSPVEITIYNILGQKVEYKPDLEYGPGSFRFKWQPKANTPAGVYFYEIKSKEGTELRRMLYLKNKTIIPRYIPE